MNRWYYVTNYGNCVVCGCFRPLSTLRDAGTNSDGLLICIDREWCERMRARPEAR